MTQPAPAQGASILRTMLRDRDKLDEFSDDLILDVSAWLGHNPRAMRAFVGCLVGQPVEELIDRDSESWELRHRPRSPQLTARLEYEFWNQSLGRLDQESVTLAENLSVFRRPFRVEAIKAAGATIHTWESARNRLALSFILDRNNAWYELNPVVRKLTAARLSRVDRRFTAANARAADFFAKRIDDPSYRDSSKAGGYFVEARYHYLAAGRRDSVEAIAGKYRGLLLRTYRGSQIDLSDPSIARERIPVLLAALDHGDAGYESLRAALVQLLEVRGAEGDDIIALRHARLASVVRTPLAFWMAYARIAARVETDAFLAALARRSLSACAVEPERVVVAVAEQLFLRGQIQMSLRLIDEMAPRIAKPNDVYLTRLKAFILDRTGKFPDAFDLMLDRHRAGGTGRVIDRLLEEASFLALHHGDEGRLAEIAEYARGVGGLTRQSAPLAEMLMSVLRGDYEAARTVGEAAVKDPAVAAQVAFCCLSLGRFEEAANIMRGLSAARNAATHWLSAVIALCNGDADTYIDAITRASRGNVEDSTVLDERTWLRVWDEVPASMGPFPAFYFPRLPPRLTGLQSAVVRTYGSGSQGELIRESRPLLGAHVSESPAIPDTPVVVKSQTGAPMIYVQQGNIAVAQDEYNNYGQVGAMGRRARVDGDIHQRQELAPAVAEAIRQLADHARDEGQAETAATLDEVLALELASEHDEAHTYFSKVRNWVIDKVSDGTVAIAAGLVLAAFGV
ncbi:hypothetical protein [Microbacterium sp.]|uniref:hypothetical protein n=1 Tax=Microbacterium sp. TaxID=51671 RepID=UPI002811FC01|nr:hypothetical protein [Microbacterium sp.]